ncbi:putative activator of the anaphase-promoting complex/cyclosome [Cutaneotrichosporon oleaginosum]|uniref:Putative activator of the anaphase-promoting complex/cyclosome n=1 Tax=Cutaneotrichosporon oleaginosum TaxID=879819 RepID=A0A0J0XGK5_9TREE|nr:putative activator of the anaphase-promoting complex/cyclosome [Cutaneotrichosporon oleaginosum]KLT40157.1 putative activator of the anaphase-promoting complex/cyclosome [Cutaneotrichosporon oleaginosum]
MAHDESNPFVRKSVTPKTPRSKRESASITALRDGLGRMNLDGAGEFVSDVPKRRDRENRGRDLDRFVPSRGSSLSSTSTPYHDLSAELSSTAPKSRILSFRAAPPSATHATSHLDAQRAYLLHSSATANRGTGASSSAAPKKRTPPYMPERVLDAPNFTDDYYLNLVAWSSANRVAIGLETLPYVWDAETGDVMALESDSEAMVCSVSWSPDGAYLAVGNDVGAVEIWDVEDNKRVRVMGGHNARVASLSWNGHVLSSGCRDGTIFHHDVRVAQHKTAELRGHTAEVCGLTWRADGQLLASGGNDNVVNCWDARTLSSVMDETARPVPKWTKRNHTAAVKALAWCPWQPNLLATGGGSQDQHIHFWSTSTGARTSSLKTGSQVTALVWSPHAKEILSTHGYPDNNLSVWSYPALTKIYDVPAHDMRVLAAALSPDGCTVATGAGDENLKFWKIWEARTVKKADSSTAPSSRMRIR